MVSLIPRPSNSLSLPRDRHDLTDRETDWGLHQCHLATKWQKTSPEPKLWPLRTKSQVPSTV